MRPASSPADWLTLEEARALILGRTPILGTEEVPLDEASGRALAAAVASPIPHPPWANSAMDGFAVRAADVEGATPERPVRLPISGNVPAGRFPAGPLAPGTAVRVMTGAPVPEGATGVIRVEHTDGGKGAVVAVFDASDAERNIRRAGEDVRPGQVLFQPGDPVTPFAVAGLALAGLRRVEVGRRPRVAVLATGDELTDLEAYDRALEGQKIVDTNSHVLTAQILDAGGQALPLGIARDDPEQIRRAIESAPPWDALVTTAGVSMGDRDCVEEALLTLGFERSLWRVRVRPGSALLFGSLEGRPVWGLPGNPVSAAVSFEVFVRPALRKMAGHNRLHRQRLRVRIAERIVAAPGYTRLYRVRIDGSADPPVARLTGAQGSGRISSLLGADGLLVVPPTVERWEEGEEADVWLLGTT